MIHFVVRGTEEKIVPVCMGVGEMTAQSLCVCVHICTCKRGNCFCNEMSVKGIKILGNYASEVDVISLGVRGELCSGKK